MIARFKHKASKQAQHIPYQPAPRKYGKYSQDTIPVDDTDKVSEPRVKVIQQVVGGVLYYARAVDCTILAALSSIASKQAQATEGTKARIQQLLDYCYKQGPSMGPYRHLGPTHGP